MKNRAIEVRPANLKMVPYYVRKKPSLPSLMGSATFCIALDPVEWSRICPSSQILNAINMIEFTSAANAIRFAVVLEMNTANKATDAGAKAKNAILTALNASVFVVLYI